MVKRDFTFVPIKSVKKTRYDFDILKSVIESEESYLGMSFMPPNLDNFFMISEQFTESSLVEPDCLFELKFGLSSDVSYYNRQIYTGLDLLGDVGGLYDALKSFGMIFIIAYDFIFGSVFEQHLLSKIFLMDQSKSGTKKEKKYERTALSDLKKMKPFKIA